MPLWSRRLELNTPWDMGLIEHTPMDSRRFQEEYMGNFENIPMPVKDAPAGKRIDEAVVKALGWKIDYWEDETDGGKNVYDANGKYAGRWDGDEPQYHWSPSTDIKAAWKLVEIMRNMGFLCNLGIGITSDKPYRFAFTGQDFFTDYAEADTAPLAITRAFLLSRGVQEI